MEAIEFKNLEKKFDKFTLNIENLKIRRGYITGFVGPNGSGKTTTIKLIMNMIFPTKGEILIDGLKVCDKNNISIKEKIGYIGVESGFNDEVSIKNTVKIVKSFYKKWNEEKYRRLVSSFNIDENKKIGELSSGNKKLFQIALVLSTCPEIIIMDEPTANLDPIVRNKILEILQEEMENENVTIFYSTHITTDLDKAADYIVFILNGSIVLEDEKENIINNYVLIKGDKKLITEETKSVLIGYKINKFGFEGIARDKSKANEIFGNEVVYDKATVEDVLLYLRGEN